MTTSDICVLVVDASKARCFWLLEDDEPGSERIKLQEDKIWVHPESRMPDHERYKDSKPIGHQSGALTGQTHPLDDHREDHDEDEKRRFAARIADGVARLVGERSPARVVVCSSHAMGSHLTNAWDRSDLALRTDWITAEVSERSANSLHEYLAQRGVLPEPKAPRIQR